MKVKNKIRIIEAVKFTQEMANEDRLPPGVKKVAPNIFVCMTLEGPVYARVGSWIMTGIHGENWPVRDDIFHETYEAI